MKKMSLDDRRIAKDLTGQRFGRLVVTGRAPKRASTQAVYWTCTCDCGRQSEIRSTKLRQGQACCRVCAHWKHGHARVGARSPEYETWYGMKIRCHTPSATSYATYGGRGIAVYSAWRDDFAAFLRDVGPRPSRAHELDRIDPNGNYEPGNVRWVTHAENMKNLRAHSEARP